MISAVPKSAVSEEAKNETDHARYRFDVRAAIWETNLTVKEKIVLLAWADSLFAGQRTAWPSAQTLARKTSLTAPTVSETLRVLANDKNILRLVGYRYRVRHRDGTYEWKLSDRPSKT